MITIKQISAAQTMPLRKDVLRPNQPLSACYFEGDDELTTRHFGALEQRDELLGIATLLQRPFSESPELNAWQIRGMAVLPKAQGRGIGKLLLTACLEYAQGQSAQIVWCNARILAAKLYLGAGFAISGVEFEIPGIGAHYLMSRSFV